MRRAAILMVLGLSLSACKKGPTEAVATPVPDSQPTQILKSFEMNDLKKGVKSMTLKSIEARMFEAEKIAHVDQPHLDFYQNGKPSSALTAKSGTIHLETHAVEVWGQVRVKSTDSTELRTEKLRYDPATRKILSDEPVQFEKPDSITDGVGFETDPELSHTKIRHQKVRFKKGIKP